MKKITLLSFLLAMFAFGAICQVTDLEKRQIDAFSNSNANTLVYDNSPKIRDGEVKTFSKDLYVKMTPMFETSLDKRGNSSKTGEELTPSSKIENVFNWGVGKFVENGKQIFFRQKNEFSHNFGYTAYYKEATFEFLDDDKNVTKTVTLKVPDTTMIIDVAGQFSTNIFNSDDKFEFMVHARSFEGGHGQGPASCRDTLYIINEDGIILNKFGGMLGGSIVLDYQTESVTRKFVLYHVNYGGIYQTSQDVDIHDARSLELEHSISIPNELLSYSNSPILEYIRVGNNPYFYVSNYEKPFISNNDPIDPTIEMDNKFIIKLLDPTTYETVKEFKLDLIGIEDNEWSMVSHGSFSNGMKYDLSTNIFNDDEDFEILYGMSRYINDCDCERIDYYVVNEKGEILKELPKEIDYYQKLSDIRGEEEQYAALLAGGTGIMFMNMPSLEQVYTFNAVHEENLLSVNFDRVSTKDGYNWVIQLGSVEDGGNTWYGGIAYYNTKGKMVKKDRVGLGLNSIISFSAIISQQMVSPYWADTDDGNEYAYFCKSYNSEEQVEFYFGVSDDDASTPYKWTESEDLMIGNAGVTTYDTGDLKELYVSFTPGTTGSYPDQNSTNTLSSFFYELPFKSFTNGGTGTLEDPYVITNPGELNQVRNHMNSHFILVNDIDLNGFTTPDGKGWLGIGTMYDPFTGTFDGNNHVIRNLYIDRAGSYEAALFGSVRGENAEIKNLNMFDAKIINAGQSGVIVSDLGGRCLIENCHVTGTISGINSIGGVVGKITNHSVAKMCSFEGEVVSTDGDAGGIVGSVATNGKVLLSFTKGTISGRRSAGGIIGGSISDGLANNCYSEATITSRTAAGGITGDCESKISNSYATGNITSISRNAGSITGIVARGMAGNSYVKNVVGLSNKVTSPELFGRIAGESGEELISNAYALSTMLVGVAGSETTVSSSDPTLNDGADKTLAEMDQTFYESIEWKFGNDSINPWKMSGNYPRLWYEFMVRNVFLNESNLTIDFGTTFQLVANILPATAENKGLFWESSDNNVVKVSQEGLVTAVGRGTATIKVITDDGDYAATCEFTVNVPVTGVALDKTNERLNKNDILQLVATINPENANNKDVEWSSSDVAIATVSPNGEVRAIKPGAATITVRTVDGGFTSTCEVTVVVSPDRVILNETEISLYVPNTYQLEATVRPADATNKAVTWSSSDNSVATVSETGLVTAIAVGRAIVTVTTVEGGFTATCDVVVGKNSVNEISSEDINVFHSNGRIVVESEVQVQSVIIHDISGRVIYNGQDVSLPTSAWSNGIYVVKVTDINNSVKISKVSVR